MDKSRDNDNKIFEAAMRDTKPLQPRSTRLVQKKIDIGSRASDDRKINHQPLIRQKSKDPETEKRNAFYNCGGGKDKDLGLDKRRAEKLRRGQINIEWRLDLHGYTQVDAHRILHEFISSSYKAGRRCVLVITGKGGPRGGFYRGFMPNRDIGVLRRNLPLWLEEASMRPMVLRMETALPKHGGVGAYYILLRRRRTK